MTPKDYGKAVGVGIATAVILSLVMVPAVKAGISPMPEPLALAFARVLFGEVPLPVGLLFHLVYVTFWSVVYIATFKERDLLNALMLALILWVLVLILFFPIVGWGFFGLDVSPKLLVASLVPHLLFAIILWGMCYWVFPADREKLHVRA
jgi:hypothetical protein